MLVETKSIPPSKIVRILGIRIEPLDSWDGDTWLRPSARHLLTLHRNTGAFRGGVWLPWSPAGGEILPDFDRHRIHIHSQVLSGLVGEVQ